MLLTAERALALRCLACGRLLAHPFSLFSLSKQTTPALTFDCSCGRRTGSLLRRGRMIEIDYACIVCESYHSITLPIKPILRNGVTDLHCVATGVLLGCIGEEKEAVRSCARGSLEELALDPERERYFVNPEVMRSVLGALQAAAEVDRLGCACGQRQIEIEIYPEKVELICTFCQSAAVLYAEDETDLEVATQLQGLTLPASRFAPPKIDRMQGQSDSHHRKG